MVNRIGLDAFGGWRALPIAAGVYLVACVVVQALLWTDDPLKTSIDEFSPISGWVITSPFLLLLVALGAGVRTFVRRRPPGEP